jgi:hypothetical protein
LKHTPTPWHQNINTHYPIYAGDEEKRDWKHLAVMVHTPHVFEEEREANLRFIIQAVNSFYPMLAALKEAQDEDWEGLKAQADCDEAIASIIGTQDSIARAIAKAEDR